MRSYCFGLLLSSARSGRSQSDSCEVTDCLGFAVASQLVEHCCFIVLEKCWVPKCMAADSYYTVGSAAVREPYSCPNFFSLHADSSLGRALLICIHHYCGFRLCKCSTPVASSTEPCCFPS